MNAKKQKPLVEPVLELDEIQGLAVPGFFKPHQTLLYIRFSERDDKTINRFKGALLNREISNGTETLEDRRFNRRFRKNGKSEVPADSASCTLVAIAFSSRGLSRLTPGAAAIPSVAFQEGLVARSALLGDPAGDTSIGHLGKWVVGGPGSELDALVIVAGSYRDSVSSRASELVQKLRGTGVQVETEDGDVRADEKGHEHFGFDDGVSQPGIRGFAARVENGYVTERYVDDRQVPQAWLYGYPGQDLLWPGEFVLGYPASSPDPLVPGPISEPKPAWTRNGSFLVYRRLRQDVAAFWQTMKSSTERLSGLPGFSWLSEEILAATCRSVA